MNYFSTIIHATLLGTTPSFLAYPAIETPLFIAPKPIYIPDLHTVSYDEVVDLLETIESDSFEERCSIVELDRLNQLISFLALEGSTQDETADVAQAVATLFTKDSFHYAIDSGTQYTVQPAVWINHSPGIRFCKSWFQTQWEQTKAFVKKHKKVIIIGAIIAVAVAVVVVTAVTISSSAAGAAAASGGVATSDSEPEEPRKKHSQNSSSKNQSVSSSLQEQTITFKETIAQEQFNAASTSGSISMEENGRIIGSLFTHNAINTLATQAASNPSFARELSELRSYSNGATPTWLTNSATSSTDLAFSTSPKIFVGNSTDLNVLSYQARGEWALQAEYYSQAVENFGRAVELEPSDSISYLGRAVANFEMRHYNDCITDYREYTSQTKQSFSATDFSIGFSKGLPRGIYESGEGMLLFLTDLVKHPIQTSQQVYDSITTLSTLAKSGEWDTIANTLSPELCQLVSEWDSLSPNEKGELAGYAFGKHGADILLPGATAKVVAKGTLAAKELGALCKNLQIAERVLVLEAAASSGTAGINLGEVLTSAQKTLSAGEDLGLTTQQMAMLKQSGTLEQTVGKGRDFFAGNLEMQASYDFFKTAQEKLEPYVKQVMPEAEVRRLIKQSGISTFPRPAGIPDNYLVTVTDKGAGMLYVHPKHEHTYIRVMPGKPHSSFPYQQKPYIIHVQNGEAFDKLGNKVLKNSPEAHIPYEQFVLRD